MSKRKITPAVIAAKKRYFESVHQFHIRLKKDSKTLTWLRSQVNNDSEIPVFIKNMLEKMSKET